MHIPGLGLFIGFFALLLVGAIMIILLGVLILLLPAAIFALMVWLLTRSPLLSGIAFLIFGLLALLRRRS